MHWISRDLPLRYLARRRRRQTLQRHCIRTYAYGLRRNSSNILIRDRTERSRNHLQRIMRQYRTRRMEFRDRKSGQGVEILRDKIRKQANVYNSSIALVGPYTDLGPLYEAACCKTNVHGNHYVDIQDFYTALCDNTRTGCTEIASTFYRDTLHDLAEWPRLQAIIESNVTLHERCRAIADQNAGKPKCRVFSDPDRSKFQWIW